MNILDDTWIQRLYDAVVRADMADAIDTLRDGIDRTYVVMLRKQESPGEQILSDLQALNKANYLVGGKRPLETWLANAISLAGARAQASVFKDALARVKEVPVDEGRSDEGRSDDGRPGQDPPEEDDGRPVRADPAKEGSGTSKGWIVAAGIGVALLVIAILAFFVFSGGGSSEVTISGAAGGGPATTGTTSHTGSTSGAPRQPPAPVVHCARPVPGGGASRAIAVLVVPLHEAQRRPLFSVEELRARLCGASGSLWHYLIDVSDQQLDFQITLLPWMKRPGGAGESLAHALAASLAELDAAGVSLIDHDRDKDGAVDSVLFIPDEVKDPVQPEVVLRDTVGAHRSKSGDVRVDRAFFIAGMPRSAPPKLGELARAVGTALGLEAAPGREGDFSPMDTAWQMDMPPHFSGPEKIALGLADAAELGPETGHAMAPGMLLRVGITGSTAYYLLENRSAKGPFESSTPAKGLLLWRVDGDQPRLVEADGSSDLAQNRGNKQDVFPDGKQENALTGSPVRLQGVERRPDGVVRFKLARPERIRRP